MTGQAHLNSVFVSMKRVLALLSILWLPVACGYKFGLSERRLPGGYQQISIPMFKNESTEVGLEPMFTNALIRKFARSQVAEVSSDDDSPLKLEGTVNSVKTTSVAVVTSDEISTLPENTALTTDYRMVVHATIILRRRSDDKVIWEGAFDSEKSYAAPRIGAAVLNSANATYNQSARMEMLSRVADEMMNEAHDRMTENF